MQYPNNCNVCLCLPLSGQVTFLPFGCQSYPWEAWDCLLPFGSFRSSAVMAHDITVLANLVVPNKIIFSSFGNNYDRS